MRGGLTYARFQARAGGVGKDAVGGEQGMRCAIKTRCDNTVRRVVKQARYKNALCGRCMQARCVRAERGTSFP